MRPLNVLPTITNDAVSSGSFDRAPRCRLESQPTRRPWPHSTASTTRSNVYTGFTLRHDEPRRPASYGRSRSFTITPSCPAAIARSRNRPASPGSAVTIDGSRAASGTTAASTSRRTDSGSSSSDAPSACITSKKNARMPLPRPTIASAPKSPIVSWKRRGEPSSRTPSASPSSTRSPPGRAATVSTMPGSRSVTSLRLRVNRRTRPPDRWACTRAPSSFHSTDAAPVVARAAATSADGLANIGSTGRLGCKREGVERLATGGEGDARRGQQVAGQHRGAPDRRHRHVGGGGDGGGHHTVECTLAQLAPEDADQEPLLAVGRPGEHRTQQIVAVANRACTDERREAQQRVAHLEDGQRRASAPDRPSRSTSSPSPLRSDRRATIPSGTRRPVPPRPARAGATRRRAWRPSRCASWSTQRPRTLWRDRRRASAPQQFRGLPRRIHHTSATLDDEGPRQRCRGDRAHVGTTSVQRPWGIQTYDRHDRTVRRQRGRPRPRSPRGPLRRRLRRRHAAHRRPVHLGQRLVRQRPVDDARLPGRDPRTRRHRERRVVVPGEHRRPRHHHTGRRAQRPGRHEPGGPDGRPPPPRAGRHRDRQRGRVRRTQPRQGRLHREPARRRQPRQLPGAARADDQPHQGGLHPPRREAARRRAVEELLRPRSRVVDVHPTDRRDARLDRRAVRQERAGAGRQPRLVPRRVQLRRDDRGRRPPVRGPPGPAPTGRVHEHHRQHRAGVGHHRRRSAGDTADHARFVPDHAGERHPPRAVEAQALRRPHGAGRRRDRRGGHGARRGVRRPSRRHHHERAGRSP